MNAETVARQFREALGSFATGVTIVTARDPEGRPAGVTASSFNSVSLDPPLVLWSLAKTSRSYDVFCSGAPFAIHVLGSHQEELSNRFARSGNDKFAGVDWTEGETGAPLLSDFAALFECRPSHRYDGGDHVILVGEVIGFERRDHAPLLFHGGQYADKRHRLPAARSDAAGEFAPETYREEFLSYLVARAHLLLGRATQPTLDRLALSEADFAIMGRLGLSAPLPEAELLANLDRAYGGVTPDHLERMAARSLIEGLPDRIKLTATGEDAFLEAISAAKAFENHLADLLEPAEAADLRHLLRKLIIAAGGSVPESWRE